LNPTREKLTTEALGPHRLRREELKLKVTSRNVLVARMRFFAA
jgi:hypothetical protein